MQRVKNEVLHTATLSYLQTIDLDNPPLPLDIEAGILQACYEAVEIENVTKQKGRQWKPPQTLLPSMIGEILMCLYNVKIISLKGRDDTSEGCPLAFYVKEGPGKGTYSDSQEALERIIRQYHYNISSSDMKEVFAYLRNRASIHQVEENPDLTPVNNGIFDYKTKTLLPFSPDYIFLGKSPVDYVDNPVNPVIHNDEDNTDWDVETWLQELSDNPAIVELLWQIIGAAIRPRVPWDKSAFFYAPDGNNGKGTLCHLIRNLCGRDSCASLTLSDMGKEFQLEPLIRATTIITDENDVGTCLNKSAAFKALVTGDSLHINLKYKSPITLRFNGFIIQCVNEFPRMLDNTNTAYRRILLVPFEKTFTGIERKYIKHDYLNRPDVLQYVLAKVLNTNYYSLSEPDACKQLLEQYEESNDPLREFVKEMLPQCKWDLLPFTFLYDLYKGWYNRANPSGKSISRNAFINRLADILSASSEWSCDKQRQIRSANRMDAPEPLILEYDLNNWKNSRYTGNISQRVCTVNPKKLTYRGLLRQ